jgi:hypothetical protein
MTDKIISLDDFKSSIFIRDEMKNLIVSFQLNENISSVKIVEECDNYFLTDISKKEMTLLIEKLTKMRDKMIEEEVK